MVLEITSAALRRITEHANASPALEVCGLLLGSEARIDDALLCRNVAGDPRTAFEIDPAQLIAAYRAARGGGPAIVGCYHSHPGGPATPSARDAAAAAPDGAIWIIVGARGTGFYRAVGYGSCEGRFDSIVYRIVVD